ncbi:transcriptional regulator [Streptomyces sp. IMTB 2501]|uniref:helix-turn-helix transcriptional regulator n=2 Tax=unclassified Streptomyces TaxID=2593676 RepID=UPI00096C32F6|nr:helix-turn-helix domain-containing protein [Streptomyces sp. IMTB 2501]OLZ65393.1 transcriptional regulator [Streptomyces sp. IMTB 2501]
MGLDHASLTSLAALGDATRRRMFELIRQERRPVTREEVADTLGISRKLAAFHLDKLVAAGLLQARAEPPAGIRKVGRRPKVYEPVDEAIAVNIPERRYGMLADVLTEAVLTETDRESAHEAALRVAYTRGETLGSAERERLRPGRLGAERGLSVAADTLEEFGYEPERTAPTLIRLRNCPFHPLAAKAPELVCAVNQAFLAGYLHGLGSDKTTAVLAPRPGSCCVELRGDDTTGGRPETGSACER